MFRGKTKRDPGRDRQKLDEMTIREENGGKGNSRSGIVLRQHWTIVWFF